MKGNYSDKTILMETGDDFNLNLGDESYFAVMVKMFKEQMPGVRLLKFSHDPKKVEGYYCIKAIYQGSSLLKRFQNTWTAFKAIRSCHLYSLGGGQIICDPTIGIALVLRLSKSLIAIALGKKVIGYALGVGPLHRHYVRKLVAFTFNQFAAITVRDDHSKKLLESVGVTKPIHITADPALALSIPSREETLAFLTQRGINLREGKQIIIISPYGPAFHRMRSAIPAKYQVKWGLWPRNGRQKFENYIETHVQICKYFAKRDAEILFVAMDSSKWHGRDDYVGQLIRGRVGSSSNIKQLRGDLRPTDLVGVYSLGDIVIGSRLHSTILSAAAGIPFVAVSFEEKTSSFAQRLGLGDLAIHADDLNYDSLLEKCLMLEKNSTDYRNKITIEVNRMRQQVYDNVLLVKELVSE